MAFAAIIKTESAEPLRWPAYAEKCKRRLIDKQAKAAVNIKRLGLCQQIRILASMAYARLGKWLSSAREKTERRTAQPFETPTEPASFGVGKTIGMGRHGGALRIRPLLFARHKLGIIPK